ncbi:hypothetical protein M422DRAFT_162685 [Sphaerobolus stellatus SS14]|nr:hypothetical protein M422DRAFT_162685 [Sphaerobolus stellatus SS14]
MHISSGPASIPISQCNTGDAQCCNSVSSASDPSTAALLGLLGAVVQGVDVLVGLGCTPITVIGAGQGANCAQQPVCCTNNSFNGVANIGCTPISL